jgi:hypothetical protein
MNTTHTAPKFNRPGTAARITAFVAAAGMTTLLVASQFGLASHYTDEAGQLLAQQPLTAPLATAAAPTARQPG